MIQATQYPPDTAPSDYFYTLYGMREHETILIGPANCRVHILLELHWNYLVLIFYRITRINLWVQFIHCNMGIIDFSSLKISILTLKYLGLYCMYCLKSHFSWKSSSISTTASIAVQVYFPSIINKLFKYFSNYNHVILLLSIIIIEC